MPRSTIVAAVGGKKLFSFCRSVKIWLATWRYIYVCDTDKYDPGNFSNTFSAFSWFFCVRLVTVSLILLVSACLWRKIEEEEDNITKREKFTMTIAAYVRVSSRHRKSDSQVSEIKKWLGGNGIDLDDVTWFIDKESGKTLDHPQFKKFQQAIVKGEIKTVVVYKLDRISRRLKDGVNALADWCERGIRVVVVTRAIDLSGPVGRMIAAVLLGLIEVEVEFRRERQAAGIEVARRKGVYQGRKKGSTKGKPERARELRDKGLNVAEIATAMGTSERTVWRYLASVEK